MQKILKPWREVAIPHEDVLKGTFSQAEFAADLSRVHEGTATAEYQDAALFFERTFITEGMRLLLDSVIKRLTGNGGDPVIQLQTAFGGGKTHTMLAVYHLAKGEQPASNLQGIPSLIDAAGATELPKAYIAVLDGIKSSPNQPITRDGQTINTLWGDLAWQLGGAEGYALVADADSSGTSPGKSVLENLLNRFSPCVILIDELVAYIRQFEEGKTLTGGSFGSNLSFIQALTEALKAVPTGVLLASLPQSNREAGDQNGINALATLSHYFGRIQALWKPVGTEEAFEIVRRRLFCNLQDLAMVEAVCREFSDFYIANKSDFPQETQESRYFERLKQAYPIHPEIFDRLYEDWSSLDNFQRTRGVLKMMAQVIHRLWNDSNNDLLIMPGNLPLYNADTRNGVIYYLPQGWDPVIEKDVDGDRAETTEIENSDTRLGSLQACRRSARTIFLGSAPSTAGQTVRGLEVERVMLGVIQPGQSIGIYKDALLRLTNKLHYLNHGSNRYWFDTRPNLRKEMEERKRRFQDKEDVYPTIREQIRTSIASDLFKGIHVFTPSNDVPDDWHLRLVVLPPDATFNKFAPSFAIDRATEILKNRGEQPRFKQNRLIFLAADFNNLSRLIDHVRSKLAWESIVSDIKDTRLNLDQLQAKQATKNLEDAKDGLRRMIRETYKWLLVPMQEAQPGKGLSNIEWENFALNANAQNMSKEMERILAENELLITEWSPIHLHEMLKSWFWKDDVREVSAANVWQQTCQQLYLPRLKDDIVFQSTLNKGSGSKEYFGFAYGEKDSEYSSFSFGKVTSPLLATLRLIETSAAFEYQNKLDAIVEAERKEANTKIEQTHVGSGATEPVTENKIETKPPVTTESTIRKHFYASVELDSLVAKKQFADLVDEIILQFTSKPGVKVKISLEIEAESAAGFDDSLQRAVKENCNVMKFKNAEFE
jgi:predicted AAA+ superfamily ATPase